MKIIRHTEDELVVRDGSLVRIAIGIAAYSFLFYFVNRFGLSRWWSIVLCLVIAVVIFSTTTITTFTFDAQRKTVNWRTGLLFNLSSRTIPFADIRDICVDGYFLFGTVRYRLSVVTQASRIPMARMRVGNRGDYEEMRDIILRFAEIEVRPITRSADEISKEESAIRALLLERRKIDAIKMLRASENLGIAEAKSRVDQIDREMRAGY